MMSADFEDLRQSEEWAEYLHRLGWQREGSVFVRKLPLIGSVAKIQRPREVPTIEEIDKIAQKHRALFVKLEPGLNQELRIKRQGFESDEWPLLPSKTIWIDLAASEDEIWASFSKDARYSIRQAQRSGVTVKVSQPKEKSLQEFYRLFKEIGKRKNFWVPPFGDLKAKIAAFKDKAALFLAYHQDTPVAGALAIYHNRVAYYHHAASSSQGRELLAAYLIIWEIIKEAKQRDCHTLDLEGIYDPRYKTYHRWQGISVFKRKFGGEEIEYPGTFIRYYNPLVKITFKSASRLAETLT